MADREKVIKGLETIKQFFGYGLPSTAEMFDSYYDILNGAIALLKEQEPVAPQKHYNKEADLLYACGKCHNDLKPNNRNAKFCWFCGKSVLWE